MRTAPRAVAGLLAAALLLVGCAAPVVEPVAEIADTAGCLADEVLADLPVRGPWQGRPAPAAGRVPRDFHPVLVIECWVDARILRPGDPVTATPSDARVLAIEKDGDLGRLLAVLAEPSEQPEPDTICPADYRPRPVLFLVDASGRAVRPAWPTTACGRLKPGAREALAGLRTVTTTPLTRARS